MFRWRIIYENIWGVRMHLYGPESFKTYDEAFLDFRGHSREINKALIGLSARLIISETIIYTNVIPKGGQHVVLASYL